MVQEILQNNLIQYLAIFIIAFSIVVFSLPSIIYFSLKHELFDRNDLYRKNHKQNISRLGGIAIFSSLFIILLLLSVLYGFREANLLIVACIILAALGLKDDLYGINASPKFILQTIVAVVLVLFGNFRLSSLYGVFNIGEIDYISSVLFSIPLIIFLNNIFNLIDGVDGLAAVIGILTGLTFGILFAAMDEVGYAFIGFALAGALVGFIKYNWWPAKIFMGDTGALTIGLLSAVLAIRFIELNKFTPTNDPHFYSAPAIAVAILIVPIFDSLRVFALRIFAKKSPFTGDRNHLHHRMQRIGFSVQKLVLLTALLSIWIILFTFFFSYLGNFLLMIIDFGFCIAFNMYIGWRLRLKEQSN